MACALYAHIRAPGAGDEGGRYVNVELDLLAGVAASVEQGNAPKTKSLVQQSLSKGVGPWDVLNEGIMPALRTIGEQLKDGTISLPEVMISVGAVKAALSILGPLLVDKSASGRGVVVIGTVAGDVHSLGKELVAMMLEGSGFTVIDLGFDVDASRFVETAVARKARIVALSGLLTTSRLSMRETIEAFESAGLRGNVSIIVGGGAVDRQTALGLGADAYGEDASVVSDIALGLLSR
jgi:5-methyltetrahydrofolate--homocysteine methyltransferase